MKKKICEGCGNYCHPIKENQTTCDWRCTLIKLLTFKSKTPDHLCATTSDINGNCIICEKK